MILKCSLCFLVGLKYSLQFLVGLLLIKTANYTERMASHFLFFSVTRAFRIFHFDMEMDNDSLTVKSGAEGPAPISDNASCIDAKLMQDF